MNSKASAYALPGATLSYQDLAYSAQLPDGSRKQILEPCSGSFEPGQLVAIMGPSGSGKTTLLDMLAMKKTSRYEGEVRVNGHLRDTRTFRRIAAYVGQEDCMPAHWRVREAVEFNARLKQQPGAKTASRKEVRRMVDVLLEEFGLAEVQNTYVGGHSVRGISGGQRKRVSIARAVAARAPILFCDEPTSGLSATDAELCVRSLSSIVKQLNVLALVVIHQPRAEVVGLFDTLVLLTSNPGRVTYHGPMKQAPAYFGSLGFQLPAGVNPADAFLDLVTPGSCSDASDALAAAFQSAKAPALRDEAAAAAAATGPSVVEMVAEMQGRDAQGLRLRKRAAPLSTQVQAVLGRKVRTTFRNPLAGGLTVLLPCVMGTLLGSVFQGIGDKIFLQQTSFFFILVTGSCFQSMGFMAELVSERTYMKYETSEALYDESVLALANFAVDVPLALLGASLQICIAFTFSGMAHSLFWTIFGWTLLVFFVYDSLFACVAAFAPDAQLAQLLATPCLTIFMLFNGFCVSRGGSPPWFRWIFDISPNFHAMQSIITSVAAAEGTDAVNYTEMLGYKAGQEETALVVMVGSIVVLRLLQIVGLKFFNHIQK